MGNRQFQNQNRHVNINLVQTISLEIGNCMSQNEVSVSEVLALLSFNDAA